MALRDFRIGPPGEEADLLPMVVRQASMFRRGVGGADYDDAVSEAILHTIRGLERYDPAKGTRFSTFAFPCIRGAALDLARREARFSRHHELHPDLDSLEASAHEHDVGQRLLFAQVMSVIENSLPPKLAHVLLRTYMDGASDRDIGAEIGVRPGRVPLIRELALGEVRRLLEARDGMD